MEELIQLESDFFAFGVPLDPDPGIDSIGRKLEYIKAMMLKKLESFNISSPYEALKAHLKELRNIKWKGEFCIESWLSPTPDKDDIALITPDNFLAFIETNGCKEYADKVRDFILKEILPHKPLMIGCDHSVTGGVIEALSNAIGRDNLTLIILDNHLDAILPNIRNNLIGWAREKLQQPLPKLNPFDYSYFVSGVPDTFNSGSFLYFLIENGTLIPKNVILIGASDYPNERLFQEKDTRVKDFLNCYIRFEKMGGKIIKGKSDYKMLDQILSEISTQFVYVSFDADIGNLSAFTGCRTKDIKGLDEIELYEIAKLINKFLVTGKNSLAGFDIMEIDVYSAGKMMNDKKDKTYDVISRFVKYMLEGY